jgi:hypothetical protein
MYVIANQRTGQGLTSCLDRRRADLLMYGFEQLTARDDLGGRDHYWHVGRPLWGWPHPYDLDAKAKLEAERDQLIAAHRRNTACVTDD